MACVARHEHDIVAFQAFGFVHGADGADWGRRPPVRASPVDLAQSFFTVLEFAEANRVMKFLAQINVDRPKKRWIATDQGFQAVQCSRDAMMVMIGPH
jgi:hypothetical protein